MLLANNRPTTSPTASRGAVLNPIRANFRATCLDRLSISGLAFLFAGLGLVHAENITIPNGSFELPSTTYVDPRVDVWQKTAKPFWYDESGGYAWDQLTGVFINTPSPDASHIDNVEGAQALFLFAVPEVGLYLDSSSTNNSTGQAFAAQFEAGKSYTLTVGAIGGGGNMAEGVTLSLGLYYLDATTNRVNVATATITNSLSAFPNTTHLVDFQVSTPVVQATDAWAGRPLGIQLLSTVAPTLAGGYWDLDNVRLEASAAPNTNQLKYAVAGTNLILSWFGATNYQYQLESTTNFDGWSNVGPTTIGTGTEMAQTNSLAGSDNAFFRLKMIPLP